MNSADPSRAPSARGHTATALLREQPIDPELCSEIGRLAESAAAHVAVDPASGPDCVIAAVDAFVREMQQGGQSTLAGDSQPEMALGALWGEQLVRGLGWLWTAVTFHGADDITTVAVVSPDRALVIYPFHFIHGCLEHAAPVTILLAWEILTHDGRVPSLPADSFENVMDHAHHPVPLR